MEQKSATDAVGMGDLLFAWQMPARLMFSWWNMALKSFDHSCGPHHPACSEEDEGQLVVPEPMEDEGDHALFA